MARCITVAGVRIGGRQPLALIAGPCVIEGRDHCLAIARRLYTLAQRENIPLIFKASYDKANRTSGAARRGPGIEQGLAILAEVKKRFGLPLLTDVHQVAEVSPAAKVVDILQIPAFLCRQTDLLLAAGASGRAVNVKKGQFLAPWDMSHVVQKIESTGNRRILLTERGVSFGYNNLVADMRSILVMKTLGYPVVFDATHSVQRPGGLGAQSGGDAQWAAPLAAAAAATGCDAIFMETHPQPSAAWSDGPNSLPLTRLRGVWRRLSAISRIARRR